MTRSTHTLDEKNALDIAAPILESIYGEFCLLEEQVDRPDAAIRTQDGKIVGVEITNIDIEGYLKYVNSTLGKLKPPVDSDVNSHMLGQTDVFRVELYPNRISSKLIAKKNHKYSEYRKINPEFKEVILLLHTTIAPDFHSTTFPTDKYLYAISQGLRDECTNFDRVVLVNLHSKAGSYFYSKFDENLLPKPDGYNANMWQGGRHYVDCLEGSFYAGTGGGEVIMDCSLENVQHVFGA